MTSNIYEDDVERADPEWRTPNLALCAWLMYSGHRFSTVEFDQYRQAFWVFKNESQLQEDVMLFSSGEANVEPNEFYGCIRAARKEAWKQKTEQQKTEQQKTERGVA